MTAAKMTLEIKKEENRNLQDDLLQWENILAAVQEDVQALASSQGLPTIEWSQLDGWVE